MFSLKFDFNFFKVENKQFAEQMESKNAEFTHLKLRSGTVERHLNQYKSKLANEVGHSKLLKRELEQRTKQTQGFDQEIIHLEGELEKAIEMNDQLKATQKDFEVSKVFDYTEQTSNTAELQKSVTVLFRSLIEIGHLYLYFKVYIFDLVMPRSYICNASPCLKIETS